MGASRRLRRPRTATVARAVLDLWRVRGRLEAYQRPYLVEVATALHSLIHAVPVARVALRLYRWAMRLLLVAAATLGVLALGLGVAGRDHVLAVVVALALGAGAAALLWWWWVWSAALRLLDEYRDPDRAVPPAELPGRLLALARQGGSLADVPRRLVGDLTGLARETGGDGPA